MSFNDSGYICKCGECKECLARAQRSKIYKAPKSVREEWMQKKASEEDNELKWGSYIKIPCPQCKRERKVRQDTLHLGFSCDKCGFSVKNKRS